MKFDTQRVLGEYYGYPKCCVDEWCASHPKFFVTRPDDQKAASVEGFVPCLKHSNQIMNGKITTESLIQNRICPLPFPEQTTTEEVDEYLEKYFQKWS